MNISNDERLCDCNDTEACRYCRAYLSSDDNTNTGTTCERCNGGGCGKCESDQ